MKDAISGKKNHVIPVILTILVVILFAAVYLQGRQIGKFTDGLGDKSQTGIIASRRSFEQSVLQDGEAAYQKKIAQLETKITEMQELQDHLEDTLNKYEEQDDSAATDLPEKDTLSKAKKDFTLRKNFFKQFKDFFEQNNYPPEMNDSLFDLYIERHAALSDFADNARQAGAENIRANAKELNRRIEEINAEYDEKTAELLSVDGLALFKEYEHRGLERELVSKFKNMLGDNKLEIEKERELIELMYKGRQPYTLLPFDLDQSYKFPENEPDAETMARLKKEEIENMRKVFDSYVESVESTLSESQAAKFKGLLNGYKTVFIPDNTAVNNSDKE